MCIRDRGYTVYDMTTSDYRGILYNLSLIHILPRLLSQRQRRPIDILLQMGGAAQPGLAGELAEVRVPDGQRHAAADVYKRQL